MKTVRYIDVLPGLQIRLPEFKLVHVDSNKQKLVQVKAIPAK